MSTTINKTDGSVLVTIPDGAVNQSATNIALIGKLFRNYGELVNENFVKILENFANSSSPSTPIIGQLWYDTSERRLKVFRDTGFVALATNNISNTEPLNPRPGDQWFDNVTGQLKFYNGTSWIVIAPSFTSAQGKSGTFVETIQDTTNANRIIVAIYQQGTALAIFSRDVEFTPGSAIAGFTTIKTGLNLSNQANFKMHGDATNSEQLDGLESSQFLRSDVADEGTATLSLTNNRPLELGPGGNLFFQEDGSTFKIGIPGSGSIGIYSNETNLVTRFTSGNQVLLRNGTNSSPTLSFEDNDNTGIYRAGTNQLGVTAGGSLIASFSPSSVTVDGEIFAQAVSANAVNGDAGAFNSVTITNTLVAPVINGNTLVNADLEIEDNLLVRGDTVLGNGSTDQITFNASTLFIPNSLTVTGNNLNVQENLTVAGNILVTGSIAAVSNATYANNLTVENNLFVDEEVLVGFDSNTNESAFRVDSGGRILIGTAGPSVATQDAGEVTLGFDKGIYAANTAKYWVAFKDGGDLELYQAYNVASITRVATGKYRINFEYNLTPNAYYAVVGTSSFGNLSMETFPTGGADFIEVRVELYNYTLTNNANYISVAVYGP